MEIDEVSSDVLAIALSTLDVSVQLGVVHLLRLALLSSEVSR